MPYLINILFDLIICYQNALISVAAITLKSFLLRWGLTFDVEIVFILHYEEFNRIQGLIKDGQE